MATSFSNRYKKKQLKGVSVHGTENKDLDDWSA